MRVPRDFEIVKLCDEKSEFVGVFEIAILERVDDMAHRIFLKLS